MVDYGQPVIAWAIEEGWITCKQTHDLDSQILANCSEVLSITLDYKQTRKRISDICDNQSVGRVFLLLRFGLRNPNFLFIVLLLYYTYFHFKLKNSFTTKLKGRQNIICFNFILIVSDMCFICFSSLHQL